MVGDVNIFLSGPLQGLQSSLKFQTSEEGEFVVDEDEGHAEVEIMIAGKSTFPQIAETMAHDHQNLFTGERGMRRRLFS